MEFVLNRIQFKISQNVCQMLGLDRSSSRNPEVLFAQVVLLSCDLLDEDDACGVHIHQVVAGGSKVNPVSRSLLWRGGWVKKCRLLKQNKRTLKVILTFLQKSPNKPSAKELACVEVRKLNSLDQRSSSVEIFHQVVSCQLQDRHPTSGPVTRPDGAANDKER